MIFLKVDIKKVDKKSGLNIKPLFLEFFRFLENSKFLIGTIF